MVFVKRTLDAGPVRLGEKLRALRRGKAVSLDMMEQSTRIQRAYLEALEWGKYEDLPEPLYTRNFIRSYVRALGGNESYFLELFEEECGACDLVSPMQAPAQRVRMSKFFVQHRAVMFLFVFAGALGIFGYLGWQLQSISQPPQVVLLAPQDAIVTNEPMILTNGVVEGEATVYVNGIQVVVNEEFYFETVVDLEKGLNTIVVEAERRYSRRFSEKRRVFFDPSFSDGVTGLSGE